LVQERLSKASDDMELLFSQANALARTATEFGIGAIALLGSRDALIDEGEGVCPSVRITGT
jgi:hypothetical protein